MDDQLRAKLVDELTDAEKRQLITTWTSEKEVVKFSQATLDDCVRDDGLGLDLRYLRMEAPTIHIPLKFVAPSPSEWLSSSLKKIRKAWVVDNEKAARIIIDAILTEVLSIDVNVNLLGFCEVRNDWASRGVSYTGCVDYMIGSSLIRSIGGMDSYLLIVEAKKDWLAAGLSQVVCEAGCLLKRRLATGKRMPVFAVLTNGLLFRFFAIDVDGTVFASGEQLLAIGVDNTYASSQSLSEIIRWFVWILTWFALCSPRASREAISQSTADENLRELRQCFGPRNHNV